MTAGVQEFDFSVNLSEAILWQQNNATKLQAVLAAKQAWYDQFHTQFWTDWVTDVFNLDTANDFGLSVWAIILNMPLVFTAASVAGRKVFGFGEFNENLFEATFAPSGSGITLTTEERRLILKLRFYQLVSSMNVPEINAAMQAIFAKFGTVYVLDGLNMTCEYVFQFYPSSSLLFILQTFDLLPRPAGVEMTISVNPGQRFGFGPFYDNFYLSNFGGRG